MGINHDPVLKDLKLDGEEIKGKQNKPNIKSVPANTSVPLTDHRESPDHNPKDFYNEYNQGTLSDDIIFIEWANDYRHYLALRQELEQILNHAA